MINGFDSIKLNEIFETNEIFEIFFGEDNAHGASDKG
jgi:hypothetical protein